jgi:hypothetical protein
MYPDWNKLWALFMSDPVDFLAFFGVAIVAVAIFAWWLRGHIGKERIAALEERLRLAGDNQQTMTREVERLQTLVPQLPQGTSSAMVAQSVNILSTANNALGTTLTIVGGRYRVFVEPDITNRSD